MAREAIFKRAMINREIATAGLRVLLSSERSRLPRESERARKYIFMLSLVSPNR